MLSNFAVCPLASVILLLVIVINLLDIYLVGTHFKILLTNLVISVLSVWIANKTCYKYQWVSWVITFYFIFCIVGAVLIILNPSILNGKGYEETKALVKEAGRVKVDDKYVNEK